MLILSDRLSKIASFVLPGSRVVDVGTDHAYIPIWLVLNKICDTVIATDIHYGPLEKARADARIFGVEEQINFIQCDGLAGCNADLVDTIIIAGLGGDTIISILTASPWALNKTLIIQTQTKHEELKEWLIKNDLSIFDGCLVFENEHYYTVWVIKKGNDKYYGKIEKIFLEKKDPLLLDYINCKIEKINKRINGIKKSSQPDEELISQLDMQILQLINYRKEVQKW